MKNQKGFVFVSLLAITGFTSSFTVLATVWHLQKWQQLQKQCRITVLKALQIDENGKASVQIELIEDLEKQLHPHGDINARVTPPLRIDWSFKSTLLDSIKLIGQCEVSVRKEEGKWIKYLKKAKFLSN